MAGKRKCIVCGSLYDYCPNCSNEQPRWRFLFDTKNCNDIWEVFNAYRTKQVDAAQAEKDLRQLDLSQEDNFDPVWKSMLIKIRAEAKPEEKAEPKPEEKVEKKDEQPKRFNKDFKKR